MHEWLQQASATIGGGELSDDDATTLLALAGFAAHTSGDRTNAPLLCYLVGRHQQGRPLAEILEAIEQSSS